MFFNGLLVYLLLVSFHQIFSFETLLTGEDAILKTGNTILNTTDILFSLLGLKNISGNPKLKEHNVVHKYFLSLTTKDHDVLKNVTKLTRNDKESIDNRTSNFITIITDIIEELKKEINNIEPAIKFNFDDELARIEYLKRYYDELDNKTMDINKEVLKIVEDESIEPENTTTTKPGVATKNFSEFWNDDEEEFSESGRRIFGGQQSSMRHFPFMAAVQLFNKFQCGGSVIDKDFVITAASCLQLAWNNRFYRENPLFLSVRIGTSFIDAGGEVVGVLEIYFHPNYNPKNLFNNIALMRLQRSIHFVNKEKTVKKIKMDEQAHKLPLNTYPITIVGWGARSSTNVIGTALDSKMRFANLHVYPVQDCQDIYTKEFVTNKNFCAGSITKGDGACNRDIGGPGVYKGVLVGVISFGAPVCGTPDAPTVFTKVGYYFDWIEDIMKQPATWVYQRTTTTARPLTYGLLNYRVTRNALTPVSGDLLQKVYNIKSAEEPLDKNILKDSLRAIFESSEINEYFDAMKKPDVLKVPLQENSYYESTTSNPVPIIPATPIKKEIYQSNLAKTNSPGVVVYDMENSIHTVTEMGNISPLMTLGAEDESDGESELKSLTTQPIESQKFTRIQFVSNQKNEMFNTIEEQDPDQELVNKIIELGYDKVNVDETAIFNLTEIVVANSDQEPANTIIQLNSSNAINNQKEIANSTATDEQDPDKELVDRIIEFALQTSRVSLLQPPPLSKQTTRKHLFPGGHTNSKYYSVYKTVGPKFFSTSYNKKRFYPTNEQNSHNHNEKKLGLRPHPLTPDPKTIKYHEISASNEMTILLNSNDMQTIPPHVVNALLENDEDVAENFIKQLEEIAQKENMKNSISMSKDDIYYVLKEIINDENEARPKVLNK